MTECPNNNVKVIIDLSIPTDERLKKRRPDIVVITSKPKRVEILEVACVLDHLIEEREQQKQTKYQALAVEMVLKYNCRAEVYPIVIGNLGCIGSLKAQLQAASCVKNEGVGNLVTAIQKLMLDSNIRIIRHFFAEGK